MSPPITGISSMATRHVLAELCRAPAGSTAPPVTIESVGGVDAARRVQAGEPFDLVFLAAEAIDRLVASGQVRAGSRVDLMRSPVAAAVRAGTAPPGIGSEPALKAALLAARTIGYSTGPSGSHLLRLFERWGLADTLAARTVQAPPGVPVGALVARGEIELGFQQLGELLPLDGLTVLGPLPAAAQHLTTFSGAVCSAARQPEAAQALLRHLADPAHAAVKRRHGMEPA